MSARVCKNEGCDGKLWLDDECRPCHRKTLVRLKPKPSAFLTAQRLVADALRGRVSDKQYPTLPTSRAAPPRPRWSDAVHGLPKKPEFARPRVLRAFRGGHLS